MGRGAHSMGRGEASNIKYLPDTLIVGTEFYSQACVTLKLKIKFKKV